jgi:hypothetical protein
MAVNRYNNTPFIIVDGNKTRGSWSQPSWLKSRPEPKNIGRLVVSSQYEGRPDLIAKLIYNNSELDWVLLAFNNVDNPFGWPRTGLVIEYPSENLVFPEL